MQLLFAQPARKSETIRLFGRNVAGINPRVKPQRVGSRQIGDDGDKREAMGHIVHDPHTDHLEQRMHGNNEIRLVFHEGFAHVVLRHPAAVDG